MSRRCYNLTQPNTAVFLETSGPPAIAQLAVDTGQTTMMTFLTPVDPQ